MDLTFTGGWNRLQNRLLAVNLVYKGQKIPKQPLELAKAIEELKITAQSEGIDITCAEFPDKALTYNPLVSKLEHHGILGPLPIPPVNPPVHCAEDEGAADLRAAHKDAVSVLNLLSLKKKIARKNNLK